MAFLTGSGHFLRIARTLDWDEAAIDVRSDAPGWAGLAPTLRASLRPLLAGFCLAEARVAAELAPFAPAAVDAEMAECFRAQARDEARHARFFDRVAAEVLGVPGATPLARADAVRRWVPAPVVELFDVRLPALTRRLRADPEILDAAVSLYHLVLEGIVLTAGELALLELLGPHVLPEVRAGVERVLRDERWHVGFGIHSLHALPAGSPALGAVLADAPLAVDAWGPVVPLHVRSHVLAIHRRRLRAGRLGPEEVLA